MKLLMVKVLFIRLEILVIKFLIKFWELKDIVKLMIFVLVSIVAIGILNKLREKIKVVKI